jgi:hypothetical protein
VANKALGMDDLFKGRHFEREIIIVCVRWYLRFKLSLRDLVEMMAERGLSLAHTTILRWVQHYVPEFEKRSNRFARQAARSWIVDETADSRAFPVFVAGVAGVALARAAARAGEQTANGWTGAMAAVRPTEDGRAGVCGEA